MRISCGCGVEGTLFTCKKHGEPHVQRLGSGCGTSGPRGWAVVVGVLDMEGVMSDEHGTSDCFSYGAHCS